jgi:hypothetical protein
MTRCVVLKDLNWLLARGWMACNFLHSTLHPPGRAYRAITTTHWSSPESSSQPPLVKVRIRGAPVVPVWCILFPFHGFALGRWGSSTWLLKSFLIDHMRVLDLYMYTPSRLTYWDWPAAMRRWKRDSLKSTDRHEIWTVSSVLPSQSRDSHRRGNAT